MSFTTTASSLEKSEKGRDGNLSALLSYCGWPSAAGLSALGRLLTSLARLSARIAYTSRCFPFRAYWLDFTYAQEYLCM